MVLKNLLKNVKHHAPTKQKFARGNHLPFMNETFSEGIFTKNILEKKLAKTKESVQRNEITVLTSKKIKEIILQ